MLQFHSAKCHDDQVFTTQILYICWLKVEIKSPDRSSTISSNQSISRQNSELKKYFNGKRNNSLGGNKDNCVLPQGGTIIELSEHSTSDCYREHVNPNFRTNSEQVKNMAISEFNPFRFIWTIKSSSYECVCNRKGRKRTISFWKDVHI